MIERGPVERPLARVRRAWPLRRLVAVAVLFPVMMTVLVAVAGGSPVSPGWLALAGLVALATAATLATYVPRAGAGARLDVGCTPCAAVAALTVPIAVVVLGTAPQDVPTALMALGVAAFGLSRRLTDPSACPA